MAEKSLLSAIGCRFVPATLPVEGSYSIRKDGRPARRDCTVKDPSDIPSARSLADTQALLQVLHSAYVENGTEWFREEVVRPQGDVYFEPYLVAHGLLLSFYLRVLARTFAADPAGSLGRALGKQIVPIVQAVLVKPNRGTGKGSYMEESVVGVSEIVQATPSADIAAWPFLWSWASNRTAQPRTRVFAMQALEAIIARGTVAANAKMLTMVEKLRQSFADWDTMWPTYGDDDKRERALAVAQANSTVATAASKLAEQGFDVGALTPIPVPPKPVPWVPLLGVSVGSVGLIIVAVLVRGRATVRAGRRRRLPRPRSR